MSQVGAGYSRLSEGAPLFALILGFGVACALCLTLCALVSKLCRRWGVLDLPGPRHIHTAPVPRLGGIALLLTFATVSLTLYRPANTYERHVYVGLLVASSAVVAVMAWDDVRGLPPIPRLCAQVCAALIAMFPAGHGALIEVLHNPFTGANQGRTLLTPWIAIPFTLFWIVGMMNTINWVDGVDGLAGGVVTIIALAMTTISWLLGQHSTGLLCAILAGATCGFLILNWHPARLFMGDSGSMFLGLSLAVLSNTGGAKLAMMLLLLALPILDAIRVLTRRLRERRSPLRADRSHLHHRLLSGGFTQRQVALLFYAVTAAFGCVTILATALQANGDLARLAAAFRSAQIAVPVLTGVVGAALIALLGIWRRRVISVRRIRRHQRAEMSPVSDSVAP